MIVVFAAERTTLQRKQSCIGGSKGGRDGRTPPPPPPPGRPKFFQFHAVFGRIWQNHAPLEDSRPHLGEILDPPLQCILFFHNEESIR